MKLEVSATRMELLKLKKRILLARRGHKLLKDKQDELMRKFLEIVEKNRTLREEVDRDLLSFYRDYYLVSSSLDAEQLKSMLFFPSAGIMLAEKTVPVMNLRLPSFTLSFTHSGNMIGFLDGNADLDRLFRGLKELLPRLVLLAEMENNVRELAVEIERTRRRVNALEYILIPNLEETIRYIGMKISEVERSNLTRLMKVKVIVEQH